ncbi:MAG: glutathione-disulfide reductase [Pseudomonadota bacterium]
MNYDYDLFVIGGGSGGVRAGRVAAVLGKKVGVAEESRFGGTCVIRGCVPKKLYVYASKFAEEFEDAAGFGWSVSGAKFDWPTLRDNKEREITRLEGLYRKGLDGAGAEMFDSRARLLSANEIYLEALDKTVTAERVLLAVGGTPYRGEDIPGHEHAVISDQAFDLAELPKSIVISGGGYIAVEFAGIFNGLGVETTLLYRGEEILRGFDNDVREMLHAEMEKKGIRVITETVFDRIEPGEDGGRISHLSNGETLTTDVVMFAIGRVPKTDGIGLAAAGVSTNARGYIEVNDYSRTSVENIWAVGDVTDRVQLTPVAIHEAMCFVDTEYKDNPQKPDHAGIATAVFSQPEIGTVGLSQEQAAERFETVEVYKAVFRPMKHTLSGRDEKMMTKLVVDAESRKVVGTHIMGPDAGEMAQLLAIPMKMGATKDDFDRTMAVHPTAAEELVTMYAPSYVIKNGERIG